MAKKQTITFKEWFEEVDGIVGRKFDTSLRDMEEDFSVDFLKECYTDGMSPSSFVKHEVEPMFDDVDDDRYSDEEDDEF